MGRCSAQSRHKFCTGPITVGKHSCETLLQWCHPLQGLYRVAGGHQKSYREAISKASTTALPDQLLLHRKGDPLPPSSPRCTNLELKQETHWPLSGLATATPTLRLSWWIGGWSGAVCSHLTVSLQALSTAHLWVTADVKSLRNKDPVTVLLAFKVSEPACNVCIIIGVHLVFAESLLFIL